MSEMSDLIQLSPCEATFNNKYPITGQSQIELFESYSNLII